MKFNKIIAATAACGILGTTAAIPVSALGPNEDDGYTYFSICMDMSKDAAKANGILDENGKGVEDGECPVSITIDKIYFDGQEVEFNAAATSMYYMSGEFKFEIINIWNNKLPGAEETVFSVEPPAQTLDVEFTVSGLTSNPECQGYFGGGFSTAGACYTTSVFGNKIDEAIPEGTQAQNVDVTGNGTYLVKVAFPGAEFSDITATDNGGTELDSKPESSESTADSSAVSSESKADTSSSTVSSAADTSKTSSAAATTTTAKPTTNAGTTTSTTATDDTTPSTGAAAGLALAGITIAAAAIVVTKKTK